MMKRKKYAYGGLVGDSLSRPGAPNVGDSLSRAPAPPPTRSLPLRAEAEAAMERTPIRRAPMVRKFADGGLVSGQKYKDRLDEAIDGPRTATLTPAAAGASMPSVDTGPRANSVAGIENVGGVGVLNPPSGKLAANFQRNELERAGVLRRKNGGMVRGPGGPRDDKIPAMLSNGEYVLPAATVKKVGVGTLERLRRRTIGTAMKKR